MKRGKDAGDASSSRPPAVAGRRWRVWLAAALTAAAVGVGIYAAVPGSAAVPTWKSVSAGGGHTCAVKTNGSLWCWGLNTYGQLGIGNTTSKKSPTQVGSNTNWDTVTAGQHHTCALRTSGARYCWGFGEGGMLGLGNDNSRTTPGNVSGEFTWKAGSLTAGDLHTCGIRSSNNAAYCWGRNPYGALGQGSVGNRNTPGLVLGSQTWVSVSAGDLQSCGVNTAGTRLCWGAAETNQLGLNSLVTQWQPTQLNGDTIVYSSVEVGGGSGCALMASPTRMRCWGTNTHGHAGTGSTAMVPAPVPVTTRAYTSVSSGGLHACAVAGSGTLYCWGHNESGQLGLNNKARKLTPTAVTGMPTGAMTLSAGHAHTCALRASDSTLYCWGSNTYGQVGIGSTTTKILVPTQLV